MTRLSLTFVFLFLTSLCSAQNPTPQPPKIHVYIIGVVDFDIQDLNVTGLKDAITLECNDIEDYFQSRFGSAVDVEKHCTASETTREAIRRYLSIDLRNGGKDDLNFVFIMSHGNPVSYSNQFLDTDLELIASDTKQNDLEFTSISAATELLPWLEKLSAKSTTLLFLDVCYGGSAKALSTKLTGALQNIFGLKNLVVSSSIASDKSYQAAFTAAVMSIIKGGECVPSQDLDRKIAEVIPRYTTKTLTGSEGYPDIVIPYIGSLCLGDIGEDGKLLFVYTGQEPKTTKYRIVGTSTHSLEGPTYITNPFFTRRENSGEYTVYIQRAGEQEKVVKTTNLTFLDFDVVWIDENANYASAASFLQQAATLTLASGYSSEIAAGLRLAAAAIYRANNDLESYKAVAELIPSQVMDKIVDPDVNRAAFNEKAVQALLKKPGANLLWLANQLALVGDFKSAAIAADVAAGSGGDDHVKAAAKDQEYLFLAASGDVNAAKRLRQRNNLTISIADQDLLVTESRAIAGILVESFQNLGVLDAVTAAAANVPNHEGVMD